MANASAKAADDFPVPVGTEIGIDGGSVVVDIAV